MAEKLGFYTLQPFNFYQTEYLSSDTYTGGTDSGNYGLSVGSNIIGSEPYVNNLPVSVRAGAINLFHSNYYYMDYYNRVHLTPASINIGNLLTTITTTFRVWNANASAKSVNAVVYSGLDGIEVTSDKTLPGSFAPMEEATFLLSATLDGPPTVDASITYDFESSTNDVVLSVIGRRIVTWPFMPQTEVTERLEWKTDIVPSYDKEQRIALRLAPRQSLDYSYICTPSQFSRMKAMAFEWSHRLYGVPIWYEAVKSAPLSSGATGINIDTQYSDFVAGGLALVWDNDVENEVVEISSKTSTSITLKRGLLNNYGSPLIAPVQLGFTPNGVSFGRSPSNYITASTTFDLNGNTNVSLTYTPTTYRGYYVATDRTLMLGDTDEKISRELDIIDSETGVRVIDSTSNRGVRRANTTATAKTISERWRVRSWVHYLRGKQKPFWLPTWNSDMVLSSLLLNSSYSMDIEEIGFTLFINTGDFMIRMKNGTTYYNRALSSEQLGAGVERLALENLFPVNIDPVDIDFISLLHLVRSDTDSVELTYSSGVMDMSIPVLGVSQ